MILVTLGTQKQQFPRLLDYIEACDIDDKIIVQAGYTKYESKKMQIFDFVDYNKMIRYVKEANIIITHGGTGSIFNAINQNKKVIACARLKEYGEHVDNHQLEIVNLLSEKGYILKVDKNNLCDIIHSINGFKPKKFISNSRKFLKKLEQELEE